MQFLGVIDEVGRAIRAQDKHASVSEIVPALLREVPKDHD